MTLTSEEQRAKRSEYNRRYALVRKERMEKAAASDAARLALWDALDNLILDPDDETLVATATAALIAHARAAHEYQSVLPPLPVIPEQDADEDGILVGKPKRAKHRKISTNDTSDIPF